MIARQCYFKTVDLSTR